MIIVAHKCVGGADAIERVMQAGANAFEVDVHGGPHGPRLSHFAPVLHVPGWLERDGWSFRLAGRAAQDPLLDRVLGELPAGARVLLDLKEELPGRRRSLNAALLQRAAPGLAVTTGNVKDVDIFGEAGFETWRTLANRREVTAYLAGRPPGGERLTVNHEALTRTLVRRLVDEATATLVAWTVNDPGRADELVSWGVQGVTTDSTAVMQSLR